MVMEADRGEGGGGGGIVRIRVNKACILPTY